MFPSWTIFATDDRRQEDLRRQRLGLRKTGPSPPTADQHPRPGRSTDSRVDCSVRIAFPRRLTQWLMIQLRSLTVAGAVPGSTQRSHWLPVSPHPRTCAGGTPDQPLIIEAAHSRGQPPEAGLLLPRLDRVTSRHAQGSLEGFNRNAVRNRGCPRNCNRRANVHRSTEATRLWEGGRELRPGSQDTCLAPSSCYQPGCAVNCRETVAATVLESSSRLR